MSQNVLAVVDMDMRYSYVLAGWEGSAHDVRVLYSALNLKYKAFEPPAGKYFLGDAGYFNRKYLLVPYRGTRYHLKEWNSSDVKYN